MQEIQERVLFSEGLIAVDRQGGVIKNVKIVGLASKNGREYPPEVLIRAIPHYEGARVNVNHPAGAATAPRSYGDRIGHLVGVHQRADGLYGNLHFNPKHALAEQLVWDAEHAPQNVGLSHNVKARTRRQGKVVVVEDIEDVVSVDLVADPASTGGLFESIQQMDEQGGRFEDPATFAEAMRHNAGWQPITEASRTEFERELFGRRLSRPGDEASAADQSRTRDAADFAKFIKR